MPRRYNTWFGLDVVELPKPRSEHDAVLIQPYAIVMSIIENGTRYTADRFRLTYKQVRSIERAVYQRLADAVYKKDSTNFKGLWMEPCAYEGCWSFWVSYAGDETLKDSQICMRHSKSERRMFKITGGYGGMKDLWDMPKGLSNHLLTSIIKLVVNRRPDIAAEFYAGNSTDAAQISRYAKVSTAQAEGHILDSSIVLIQTLKYLTAYVMKRSFKARKYLSARHAGVVAETERLKYK